MAVGCGDAGVGKLIRIKLSEARRALVPGRHAAPKRQRAIAEVVELR